MQLYLARVDTNYTTYAIADTEAKAKRIALKSAREWLAKRDIKYKSYAELEEWLGCSVFPIILNGATQEN